MVEQTLPVEKELESNQTIIVRNGCVKRTRIHKKNVVGLAWEKSGKIKNKTEGVVSVLNERGKFGDHLLENSVHEFRNIQKHQHGKGLQ